MILMSYLDTEAQVVYEVMNHVVGKVIPCVYEGFF